MKRGVRVIRKNLKSNAFGVSRLNFAKFAIFLSPRFITKVTYHPTRFESNHSQFLFVFQTRERKEPDERSALLISNGQKSRLAVSIHRGFRPSIQCFLQATQNTMFAHEITNRHKQAGKSSCSQTEHLANYAAWKLSEWNPNSGLPGTRA